MQDSLVAFNIISNNKLLNKNEVPVLFYWNGQTNLIESIFSDSGFYSFLKNTVFNIENYSIAKIGLFYFKYNEVEVYNEEIHNIQDLVTLSNLEDNDRSFYKQYLWKHFEYLYESAYHEKYAKEISLFDIDEYILDIYDKIQGKYPKRVIKTTVINYIRGELQNKDQLSIQNTDWIISQLENLLNERE